MKDWPDDNEALLELSGEGSRPLPENFWCLEHAFQGTQIFGATGSGKTSGSGQAIARAFLEGNLGGLVLTAKTDEAAAGGDFRKDRQSCGDPVCQRSRDLIFQEPADHLLLEFTITSVKR